MAKKGGTPENLKPVRTTEEARIRGKNGGKKSGEVRRKKRDAKSAARLILDLPCQEGISHNLKKMNLTDEDFTNRVAIMARLYTEAMTGNVTAIRTMVELAGELPIHEIENKRINLETKRFEAEIGSKESGNNAVDDWVSAVIEADEQEKNNEE